MDQWESIAERKIREAMEQGAFDDLPHKGKPIPIEIAAFEDPSLWMAHHLLRVNGFAPPWVEEAKELDGALERWRSDLAAARTRHAADHPGWRRAIEEFRNRAAELNSRILTYNLKSPSTQFHKRTLDADAEIHALSSASRPLR